MRRIKNYWTYPLFVLGLVHGYSTGGPRGILTSLFLGIWLGLAIILLPGLTAGGGDVKLMAGCGAWFGRAEPATLFLLTTVVLVTACNFVYLVRTCGLKRALKRIRDEIELLLVTGTLSGERIQSLPFAPVAALTFIAYWAFGWN